MKNKKLVRTTATMNQGLVVDVAKSSMFIAEKKKVPLPKRRWLGWWLVLLMLLVLLSMVGGLWWYISAFEQASGVSVAQVAKEVRKNWQQDPFSAHNKINFLLLGLDQISGERDTSLLTDTMMLISVKPTGIINLVSIPRDLWIDTLKTKINAVYYYGEQSETSSGSELVTTVVNDITGQPIDYVLIIKLEAVKAFIDAVGGVEVDVKKGFEDNQFPREHANIDSKDPKEIYETVRFSPGWQHFDGLTALRYIRSRHSEDANEGTDDARSKRQQEVLEALISRLKSADVWKNPALLGAVYRIFREQVGADMSEEELIRIGRQLINKPLKIIPNHIPIMEDNQPGILINPPLAKYKQWVYEPVDPSWHQLKDWMLKVMD